MKRMSLFLVAVLACTMGQMCGSAAPAIPPIEVTQQMRDACPGWSDSRILSEVADMAWEREVGFSYLDTLSSETAGCAISEDCTPCKKAILDYVWGK